MFDFDPDEWLFFAAALAVTLLGAWRNMLPLPTVPLGRRSLFPRLIVSASAALGILLTYFVLQRWSDAAVRGHPDYILLFLLGAAAWINLTIWSMDLLGISLRRDVAEQGNTAAALSIAGAILATSIVYALSNVGGGPTIWTTLAPGTVATIPLALIFLVIELSGAVIDNITLDRDAASAIRLAGALLGASFILGRAAGGNWISWPQTWADMLRYGWPAALLAIAAAIVHRRLRPTPQHPTRPIWTHGVLPALLYILVGIAFVLITPHALHPSQW